MIITKQGNRDVGLRRTARRDLRPAAHEAYLRQEMAMARRVQQRLLPDLTPPPGLSVAACFHPTQAVGGDIYDLFRLPDGRRLVATGSGGRAHPVYRWRPGREVERARAAGRGPARRIAQSDRARGSGGMGGPVNRPGTFPIVIKIRSGNITARSIR